MKTIRWQGNILIFASADHSSLFKGFLLAISIVSLTGNSVAAQSADRDPFTPPGMAERIQLADENRIAYIAERLVREGMLSVERRMAEQADEKDRERGQSEMDSIAQLEATLFERLNLMDVRIETGTGRTGVGLLGGEETDNEDTKSFIASLSFVACVNGRALYRDKQGSTFFSEVMDALDSNTRCNG